ncbi:hypothetical protein PHLGIDRAFT_366123 [Phlebiopsis gigantea 11061_1 CR5-6]|uniref:Uncharacterized protein n=1 Tax=Phlebiopsis gigantea (strain 11061_1 CR5-6) TaxID=745531 RepID=A0A0C3S9X4_PHLG1|nr:hypothetical protein PHLGIDRAFT_366123 [Phlebiopsis gigantea 11061_1 CR5-6]
MTYQTPGALKVESTIGRLDWSTSRRWGARRGLSRKPILRALPCRMSSADRTAGREERHWRRKCISGHRPTVLQTEKLLSYITALIDVITHRDSNEDTAAYYLPPRAEVRSG